MTYAEAQAWLCANVSLAAFHRDGTVTVISQRLDIHVRGENLIAAVARAAFELWSRARTPEEKASVIQGLNVESWTSEEYRLAELAGTAVATVYMN